MPNTTNSAELIKSYGIQAIENELNSLHALSQFIDEQFAAVIELLLLNQGRAIITGIGKSAIIAQKIVAKPILKAQSQNVHWWELWGWMLTIALCFGVEWWIRRYLGKY